MSVAQSARLLPCADENARSIAIFDRTSRAEFRRAAVWVILALWQSSMITQQSLQSCAASGLSTTRTVQTSPLSSHRMRATVSGEALLDGWFLR